VIITCINLNQSAFVQFYKHFFNIFLSLTLR